MDMCKKDNSTLHIFPLFPKSDLGTEAIPYKEVWEEIKTNQNIRNVAITGDFGVGKSSIIRSIADKKFRFISVYGFLGEKKNINWEYDLLTQLLLCSRTKDDSGLVPPKPRPVRMFCIIIWAVLISLSAFSFFILFSC